jgi:hypothetical protein
VQHALVAQQRTPPHAVIVSSLLTQRFSARLVQQLLATVLLLVGLKTLFIQILFNHFNQQIT